VHRKGKHKTRNFMILLALVLFGFLIVLGVKQNEWQSNNPQRKDAEDYFKIVNARAFGEKINEDSLKITC